MKYRKYHVTWSDDGECHIRKFESKTLAETWRDFLDSCSHNDGAIKNIQLITFNPRLKRRWRPEFDA